MVPPPERRRWTDAFAEVLLRRPLTVLAISVLAAMIAGTYGFFRLPLDADTNSLISRDRPWMRLYQSFLDEFGDLEYLYAVVDTKGDRAAGERAVDALLGRLAAMPDLPGVYGRIESEEQWRLATRAMPLEELERLATAAEALPALGSAETALAYADAEVRAVMGGGGLSMPKEERTRRGAAAFLLLDVLAQSDDRLAGRDAQGLATEPAPTYLASDSGRLLFVAILPRKDFGTLAAIEGPLQEIRDAIEATRAEHPAVEIGLTGKPVLQADELITSTGDTTWSFAISLLVVAVISIVVYRDWRKPTLALLAFAIAIAWTQGAAALLVGRLTLLSMVFMLVLIGAGLDYGIHIISRYIEFRERLDVRESVRQTLHTAAVGTLTGAATSAVVFLLAWFSSFQGLRELGLIAGAGLVLCAVAMVTTLPALLLLFDSALPPRRPRQIPIPGLLLGRSRRAAWWAIGIGGAVVAASLVLAPMRLRFESNLLKLQAEGLESVAWEHRVLEDSASLSWFAAVIVDSESEALDAIRRAKAEPEVGYVRSVFDLVEPSSERRDEARERFRARASAAAPTQTQTIDAETLDRLAERVRMAQTLSTGSISFEERNRLASIGQRLRSLAERLRTDPTATLAAIEATVTIARRAASAMLAGDEASLREALPAAVRARFVSPSGKLLVSLVPKGDTWELGPLKRFVAAMRSVDPQATGVPITQSESIEDMTRAFLLISLWSMLAVAVITWLDFRRLSAVALCAGVLAAGIAITVGLLALFDIPLSLANFFGVPILIGLGIDSNIHLLHRADEDRASPNATAAVEFGGTRSAVIFTALTTAIGFGGQIFASHRGMQGLGWIMTVGSLVCLATSVWLLPAALRVMRRGA